MFIAESIRYPLTVASPACMVWPSHISAAEKNIELDKINALWFSHSHSVKRNFICCALYTLRHIPVDLSQNKPTRTPRGSLRISFHPPPITRHHPSRCVTTPRLPFHQACKCRDKLLKHQWCPLSRGIVSNRNNRCGTDLQP